MTFTKKHTLLLRLCLLVPSILILQTHQARAELPMAVKYCIVSAIFYSACSIQGRGEDAEKKRCSKCELNLTKKIEAPLADNDKESKEEGVSQ